MKIEIIKSFDIDVKGFKHTISYNDAKYLYDELHKEFGYNAEKFWEDSHIAKNGLMKLTKKMLLQLNAGSSRIEFCERYKLFGFPLDRLDEIQGDHEGFVCWLKHKTNLEFDQNQNLVRWESDGGYWEKFEYDQNGNQIRHEFSGGTWTKYKYDKNGNQILRESSCGRWEKYEYDQNNNQILMVDSHGFWEKFEYDQNSNQILREDSNGYWLKFEYDQNGNQILQEYSEGNWKKFEYDQNRNLVRWENSRGRWSKYEYEFYDNGQLKRLDDLIIPYFEQEI